MVQRDEFTQLTKEALSKRVGSRCSNPGCRRATHGPKSEADQYINVGVAAHITAASPGGPRYIESISQENRKSVENGIWLCQGCAKLIDSDPKYSVDTLEEWKSQAENFALSEIESPSGPSGHSIDIQKIDDLMPDLLSEMRRDLVEDPLSREFIVMRKAWAYNSGGQPLLIYYYEDHPNLDNKFRILENNGFIHRVPQKTISRFRITERLADHLTGPIQWSKRFGGPQFIFHPGTDERRLLCEFEISGTPSPNAVEARWRGGGTEHEWTTPMLEKQVGDSYKKYQMKAVAMSPRGASDEVMFDVRFNGQDGPCGGTWVWPVKDNGKGVWILVPLEGSGVGQPPVIW